jgi:hypothetical protein
MRHKNQKPPILVGGSENCALLIAPGYMSVPFPVPCHARVAGVGQQSVWGLRVIASSSSSLLHHSRNSSILKKLSVTFCLPTIRKLTRHWNFCTARCRFDLEL